MRPQAASAVRRLGLEASYPGCCVQAFAQDLEGGTDAPALARLIDFPALELLNLSYVPCPDCAARLTRGLAAPPPRRDLSCQHCGKALASYRLTAFEDRRVAWPLCDACAAHIPAGLTYGEWLDLEWGQR